MFILVIVFGVIFWQLKVRQVGVGKNILISLIGSYLSMYMLIFFTANFNKTIAIVIIIFGGYKILESLKIYKEKRLWLKKEDSKIGLFYFQKELYATVDTSTIKYVKDIPFNRTEYFSMGFTEKVISDDNYPLLFHPYVDKKEMNFQEYGYLFTTSELIVKKKNQKKRKKENEPEIFEYIIPYYGLYKIIQKKNSIYVYSTEFQKKRLLISGEEQNKIVEVLQFIIDVGWSKSVIHSVTDITSFEVTELNEEIDCQLSKLENAVSITRESVEKTANINRVNNMSSMVNYQGIATDLKENQINDRFGGGQGHGHAGEQFGNVKDRFLGNDAEMKGSDHAKNGADRVVNGRNIQTKYCVSAGKSIGQCFDSNGAKYINSDGTMMQIEVPRDQYAESVRKMAKRIENGQVPNETNPNRARNYVKKGALSYEHSQIATKSIFDRNSQIPLRGENGKVVKDIHGNIVMQKVTFKDKIIWSAGGDFLTGASVALPTAVVSSAWIFCSCKWKGEENKEAFKQSLIGLAKPCLVAGSVYCVASQFAGSAAGKYFRKVAVSQIGKSVSKEALTGGVALGLTAGIVVGPDIVDCLRGRISMNQLVKNTTVTGAGMAGGAAAGGAVGSFIPVIGTAIGAVAGGIAGSFVAKKTLDAFVEDDAIQMISIAREEFIEVVIMSPLSQKEFDLILEKTFLNKKFSSKLKEMFASNNPREYIHNMYLSEVTEIFTSKDLPDEEELVRVIEASQLEAA